MSLISKIKEALGITAMEAAQAEARKESVAARKAAAERDERMLVLMERMMKPQTMPPMTSSTPSASEKETELINQITDLKAEIKRLQEINEQQGKAAVEAFLGSLKTKLEVKDTEKASVGRPRKDGHKFNLRVDLGSWAIVEYLLTLDPKWKFTEFCNQAIAARFDDLFESDPQIKAGFALWIQRRVDAESVEEGDAQATD